MYVMGNAFLNVHVHGGHDGFFQQHVKSADKINKQFMVCLVAIFIYEDVREFVKTSWLQRL